MSNSLPAAPLKVSPIQIATAFAVASFCSTLVLISAFGGIGAYISMVLSLPVLVIVALNWRWIGEQDATFPVIFAIGYVIFAVLIVVPGRPDGSAILILDFIPLAMAIALYVALCRVKPEKLLLLLAYSSLAGTALSFGIGGYQVLAGVFFRAEGISGLSIHYANISLLLGFLALAPLFSERCWRWYFAIAPLLGMSAALMSGSRSVILVGIALASVLFVHLVVWYWTTHKVSPWRVAVLFIGVLTVIGIALVLVDARQINRITSVFTPLMEIWGGGAVSNNSAAIRLDYYQGGLKAFLERPFFGHGWLQAHIAAAPYMSVYDPTQGTGRGVQHLHNDILQFAVCFGIPGIVAYLLVILAPVGTWLRRESRRVNYASYSVFAVVLGYIAMGLTNTTLIYEQPKVMFCFAAAGVAALAARRRPT